MTTHRIAVIAGDGIGTEVMPEGLRVLEAVAGRFGIGLALDRFDFACWPWYEKHGSMLPDDWKEQIGGHDAIFFGASRDNVLNALKAQQANVWYYRFDWDEEPAPWNDIYGAVHAADLPFIFGTFGPSLFGNVWFSSANRPGRVELSAAMMQSVSAFARSGDPNNGALAVTWPTWPRTLVFDATPTTKAIRVE